MKSLQAAKKNPHGMNPSLNQAVRKSPHGVSPSLSTVKKPHGMNPNRHTLSLSLKSRHTTIQLRNSI